MTEQEKKDEEKWLKLFKKHGKTAPLDKSKMGNAELDKVLGLHIARMSIIEEYLEHQNDFQSYLKTKRRAEKERNKKK